MQFQSWSRRSFALSAALLVGLGLVATSPSEAASTHHKHHHHGKSCHTACNGIVGVAAKNTDLSTTVTAIKKAGLVCSLSCAGPLTVFAPTNAAWAKIPKDQREGMLNDPKRLKDILEYHVVKGKFDAASLDGKRSIKTLEGQDLMLDNKDGKLIVDGGIVTTPDVKASNGMIHLIDSVAIPERGK
jgi:uncharacterized surface protein with fasciclin (FAS1) repeats